MNVRQNLSILFYRKTKKKNSYGEIPIYVRVTVDGLKDEFSSGIKVLFDQWDNETKTVFSSTPNHKVINKKIGQIRSDLERHFDLIQAKDIVATPQAVIKSYRTPINGRDVQNQRMGNLKFGESIDKIVLAYISFCKKVRNAHKNNIRLSPEKQELLDEEKEEIKKNIEKLARQATLIFCNTGISCTIFLCFSSNLDL